jgi:hypothetical protein
MMYKDRKRGCNIGQREKGDGMKEEQGIMLYSISSPNGYHGNSVLVLNNPFR